MVKKKLLIIAVLVLLLLGGCVPQGETLCHEKIAEDFCNSTGGKAEGYMEYGAQKRVNSYKKFYCFTEDRQTKEYRFTNEEIQGCKVR